MQKTHLYGDGENRLLEKGDAGTAFRNFTGRNGTREAEPSLQGITKARHFFQERGENQRECNHKGKGHKKSKIPFFGHLLELFGWWFGFTNLYALFSVCPFCGQQGCPAGMATTGILGALSALCIRDGKLLWGFLRKNLFRKRLRTNH